MTAMTGNPGIWKPAAQSDRLGSHTAEVYSQKPYRMRASTARRAGHLPGVWATPIPELLLAASNRPVGVDREFARDTATRARLENQPQPYGFVDAHEMVKHDIEESLGTPPYHAIGTGTPVEILSSMTFSPG